MMKRERKGDWKEREKMKKKNSNIVTDLYKVARFARDVQVLGDPGKLSHRLLNKFLYKKILPSITFGSKKFK